MRKRGQIWPEPSSEFLWTLPESLSEAMLQVFRVFARPNPEAMGYCHCCFPPDRMQQILHTPYRELTAVDVEPVLTTGLAMGRWHDLAYFIPCLLEDYLAASICPDALYYRILQSARPDYSAFAKAPYGKHYDKAMPKVERECLFLFFGETLSFWTESVEVSDSIYRARMREFLVELIGFLAALGSPLNSILQRWRDCYPPSARLLVSLVLADLTYPDPDYHPRFKNAYVDRFLPLTENEAALQELLQPGAVMEYLASNTEYFWMLEDRELVTIEAAFDLANAYS